MYFTHHTEEGKPSRGLIVPQKCHTVGKSSRTPFKHALYSSMLGSIQGALSTGKTPCSRNLVVVDMCAGDGRAAWGTGKDADAKASSPAILRHHFNWIPSHPRLRLGNRTGHLFEMNTQSFHMLELGYDDTPNFHFHNEDSSTVRINELVEKRNDSVLVYADPNSVDSLPITEEVVGSFTNTTLYMMTLGCNAAGIKRLPLEDRHRWFHKVELLRSNLSKWHDLVLTWLNNDSHQWAYLLAVPQVWTDRTLKLSEKLGKKLWNGGVSSVADSWDRRGFENKVCDLFLTQKERGMPA